MGSETTYPPNTHWLQGECFLKALSTVPSGYFVKGTLEFFHNLLLTVLIGHFVKETLDLFHNSLSKVLSGHIVKETPGFFQKVPNNVITTYSPVFLQRTHKELTM